MTVCMNGSIVIMHEEHKEHKLSFSVHSESMR
jgi:hypothetical protein